MYFDDYIDEVVEDEEEEEDSEDSDDGNSSGFGSFTKKSDPERVFVPNLPVGPNGKTFGSPQKAGEAKSSSTAATAGSDEEKAQEDGADVKLLAGIIDYCVVLGNFLFSSIHVNAIFICMYSAMIFRCSHISTLIEPAAIHQSCLVSILIHHCTLFFLLSLSTGPAEPFSLLRPSHTVSASGALVHTFSPVVGVTANGSSATATSSSAATGVNSDASPLPSQTFLGTLLFSYVVWCFGWSLPLLSSPRRAVPAISSTHVNFSLLPNLPILCKLGMFNQDNSEEQEVIVWDRLPRQDHFDSELPSKVNHRRDFRDSTIPFMGCNIYSRKTVFGGRTALRFTML